MLQPFETKRLLLRPFKWTDLADLHRLYSSKEVMRYVIDPRDLRGSRERLEKHSADRETYGFGLFAAILKAKDMFIGRCGLDPVIKDGELQGDLAWMFFPDYWGRGLATEFGRKMIDIAFSRLGLSRVFATAHVNNIASIRVMEKLGMGYAGSKAGRVEYEQFRIPS